jgi:hypothetical protein
VPHVLPRPKVRRDHLEDHLGAQLPDPRPADVRELRTDPVRKRIFERFVP